MRTKVLKLDGGFLLCLKTESAPSTDDDDALPVRRNRKASLSNASSTPQSEMAHADLMEKRKEQGDFFTRRGSSANKGKRNSLQARREEVAGSSDSKKRLSLLGATSLDADHIKMAPPRIE